jgi:hypothetical protein
LKVVVTQDHINRGIPCSFTECPIALATQGRVTADYIEINSQRYELPAKALKFIRYFDGGQPVAPMEFELETQSNPGPH